QELRRSRPPLSGDLKDSPANRLTSSVGACRCRQKPLSRDPILLRSVGLRVSGAGCSFGAAVRRSLPQGSSGQLTLGRRPAARPRGKHQENVRNRPSADGPPNFGHKCSMNSADDSADNSADRGNVAMGAERPWRRATLWLILLSVLFYLSYGLSNWMASQHANVGAIVFAWEHAVPFVSLTIIP